MRWTGGWKAIRTDSVAGAASASVPRPAAPRAGRQETTRDRPDRIALRPDLARWGHQPWFVQGSTLRSCPRPSDRLHPQWLTPDDVSGPSPPAYPSSALGGRQGIAPKQELTA